MKTLYDYCTANGKEALLEQWNYEKNGDLTPLNVPPHIQRKAWWRCEKGHEWFADIQSRVRGSGCPVCANRVIIAGENDLATTHPEVAAEWHPELNGELTPQMVSKGCRKKVWWICEKGHAYQAIVGIRTSGKTGCPYCTNHRVLSGVNDLATSHPHLVAQWNYEKNGDLTPQQVSYGSMKKVWWICDKGHEWQAQVCKLASGQGCPVCVNREVRAGENDLATTHPHLVAQWNYEKNGDLTPQQVSYGSTKKVWWRCEKGHEWQAKISFRSRGSGCPVCAGQAVVPGDNDFASAYPELAAQWHPTMNGDLRACDVTRQSTRKVWWKCEKGHEWQAVVANRANGTGCPYCAGRK